MNNDDIFSRFRKAADEGPPTDAPTPPAPKAKPGLSIEDLLRQSEKPAGETNQPNTNAAKGQ